MCVPAVMDDLSSSDNSMSPYGGGEGLCGKGFTGALAARK